MIDVIFFQIRRIFSSMGVDLSDETFTKFWEEAKAKDANGMVRMHHNKTSMQDADAICTQTYTSFKRYNIK